MKREYEKRPIHVRKETYKKDKNIHMQPTKCYKLYMHMYVFVCYVHIEKDAHAPQKHEIFVKDAYECL